MEPTDFFRQMIRYRHDRGSVVFDILQPCGLEEYESGKVRTVTKVIGTMSLGADAADEIAEEIKTCARRAREAEGKGE